MLPRGGFDLILQASGGLMSVTGHGNTGPAKIGAPVTDVGAGLSCVVGVLAALVERERTGMGRQVSTSLLEFSLAALATLATAYLVNGELPGLLGSHSPTFAPYGAFRARDGMFVAAGAGSEALWRRFCRAIGAPHLIQDPRFLDNASRVAARDELTGEIETFTTKRSVAHWLDIFETARVPRTGSTMWPACSADCRHVRWERYRPSYMKPPAPTLLSGYPSVSTATRCPSPMRRRSWAATRGRYSGRWAWDPERSKP